MSKFAIYKPGQGLFVRWGTVAFAMLLVLVGEGWLATFILNGQVWAVKAPALVIFGLGTTFLVFMAVNKPKSAEFMIMTESEMRKVNWPTRREVINSTKVVIFLTLLLGVMLFGVDTLFNHMFNLFGLYGN